MPTELTWFIVGMAFGLGFLLSLAVGYYLGRKFEGQIMDETMRIDADMRRYLNQLKVYWPHTDEGHIIRKLLKDRIKRIENALSL